MFEEISKIKDGAGLVSRPLKITLFRWAGSWGPFSIKIPCGECSLTKDVILDTLKSELKGIPVELDIREWLTEWWRPLLSGGWHAPIVMVDGKVISQGRALNRGLLTEAVVDAHAPSSLIEGSHVFGKEGCPHCMRAKELLEKAGIEHSYHDVVKNPAALYEMLARVKPLIGPKTPVTVPQIWLDASYVGGADQLVQYLQERKNSTN
jgi:glutaredoxin